MVLSKVHYHWGPIMGAGCVGVDHRTLFARGLYFCSWEFANFQKWHGHFCRIHARLMQ
jgi:hypothetical protein